MRKNILLLLSFGIILFIFCAAYANEPSAGNQTNDVSLAQSHEQFCEQMGGVDITKQSHTVLGQKTLDGVVCDFKNKDDIK